MNHPRNKFLYTIDNGAYEVYTNCLETAKKHCLEIAQEYGFTSVRDQNLNTIYSSAQ